MPTGEATIPAFQVDILDIQGEEQWAPPKKLRFTEEQRMIYRRLVMSWREALGQAREDHDILQSLFIFPDPSEHEHRFNHALAAFSNHLQDLGRIGAAIRSFLQGEYGPAKEHFQQLAEEYREAMYSTNQDKEPLLRYELYIDLMEEWGSA